MLMMVKMKISVYGQCFLCCYLIFNRRGQLLIIIILLMPKVGGRRKKAKSHKAINEQLEREVPKIFVVKKGACPLELKETAYDIRKCFYPNTAMKLEDNNNITFKTYLKTAKYYNVTHLVAFQNAKNKDYMRIMKIGGGQMTFRLINYCRMKDVLHNGGQPFSFTFKDPLVIISNFNETLQLKMIGKSLQEMFPPINPEKLKVERLKRVILFNYNSNKKMIYFRHYKIIMPQQSSTKEFSKLLNQKSLNLSDFASIGDYLNAIKQESDQQEKQQQMELIEIGPRLKLKFMSYKQKMQGIEGLQEEEQGQAEQNQRQ